jgi:peptidoglycan/LPS O-acetylase OafA/YrhL
MATRDIVFPDRASRAKGAESDAKNEERRFYRPELDALRFFAFLAVYLCHSIPNALMAGASSANRILAAIKDAGNFGVCLFFLLSAFLITELLRREVERDGRIHAGAFYLRRILRIWPLYFGITIVYALGGRFFPALRMEPGRVIAYFLLAGNWYIALHPWILTPLRSLWSISVEEQFYLAWPLFARIGGIRALAAASLAIVPLSLMTIYIVSAEKTFAYNTVWLNSFTQFQFFAWGALLALTLNGGVPKIDRVARTAMCCAGTALWLLAASFAQIKRPGADIAPSQFCFGYLLVGAGCIVLFLAVFGVSPRRLPHGAVYLGKISFGLYVFHEVAFLLVDEAQKHAAAFVPSLRIWSPQYTSCTLAANKIIALGVTVLFATLSYRFWESPFLRLKKRFTWIQSRGI